MILINTITVLVGCALLFSSATGEDECPYVICKLDANQINSIPGAHGIKGLEGAKGSRGPRGVKGPQGRNGSVAPCSCPVRNNEQESIQRDDASIIWGTEPYDHGTTSCRRSPIIKAGNFSLMMGLNVSCTYPEKKTCLIVPQNTKGNIIQFRGTAKPFWLSQMGFTVKDSYGYLMHSLIWLQRESLQGNITLRIHCYNTVPAADDLDKDLVLLAYNGMQLGPQPTPASSFHYNVINDGCRNAVKDTWNHADITLELLSPEKLPIIDILVRDIRNEEQAIRLEILQLCFE